MTPESSIDDRTSAGYCRSIEALITVLDFSYDCKYYASSSARRREMAVEFQEIIYEKNNRIATVTLNKPERLNSMSTQMRDELDMVIEDLENDDDTRVLIIKGAGRAFCSGYFLGGGGQRREPLVYDTGLGDQPRAQRIGASWTRRNIRMSHERWMRLWNVRQVTIAQVHGYCLAGGNDLIAVCDIVFAAEDAMIGQPQAREQDGQRGRDPDLGYHLQRRGAETHRGPHQQGVGAADPSHGPHRNREEGSDGDHRHLGSFADPQPQHQQGQ
jgi:hypothetical protein